MREAFGKFNGEIEKLQHLLREREEAAKKQINGAPLMSQIESYKTALILLLNVHILISAALGLK